ncbi:MAG TPA: hypothetical protein VJ901_07165 [Thermoanaerobaculia bacterium]|nr:hypothetical protein [Thermoanaerobaculia bacterium]
MLTKQQRALVAIATLLVAITRWLALSRTLWDWDEAQFVVAMRHFDIAAHHPHPPGFPLFIAAANALHQLLGFDEFHALQALSFIAAVLIVPAMTSFALAAGADFLTSFLASLILAFFPNVWFYGGTALSDVPSMTLIVIALALLLRCGTADPGGAGRRVGGPTLLGLAAAIRPQNLLIGAYPLLRRRSIVAVLVTGAVAIVFYATAAWATGGWHVFLDALRKHQAYLAQHDAWTSPTRPPLTHLVDDFFIRPYRAQSINILTTVLAAIALIRHRKPVLIALASFGPFCLAAWLLLDRFSASRFSVGYAPLFALLAADALATFKPRMQTIAASVYIALMIVWTWPALRIVHTTISPPVAAANWLRANAHREVYVDPRMGAFGDALLPRITKRTSLWSAQPGDYVLTDGEGAIAFRRPHGHLWKLARQRYFEASVSPAQSPFAFGEGWYPQESSDDDTWRWMGGRGVIRVLASCKALTFDFYAPSLEATITINGMRFKPPASEFMKTIGAAPEVVIETDRVAHNPNDPRHFGLRLKSVDCVR